MDTKKTFSKSQKKLRTQNVLEALKDISTGTGKSLKNDLLEGTSKDFLRQLLGTSFEPRKISGDLMPGESVRMDKAYSGEQAAIVKESRQLKFLNQMKEEEVRYVSEKSYELKTRLNSLQQELVTLAQSTQNLSQETIVAATSVPVEPGVYHISYFEKLIEYIRSFNQKINSASLWMHEGNKRAQKKNFWSTYKDKKRGGSQFLLSPDHYLTRSAG